MGEINDAVERFDRRKTAAGLHMDGDETDRDGARILLSGLDLDLDELDEYRAACVSASLNAIQRASEQGRDAQKNLVHALAALAVDGLVTGLMMGEARSTQARQA